MTAISVPLILEYEDVLLRQLPSLAINREDINDFLDYLSFVGVRHEIYYLWRPILKDPNDEMVLELAVKAQCKHIVTYNKKDFRGGEAFGVEIVNPAEFLRIIGA